MTSPVRSIVVTLLLAIVCLGHVPAWLHVAQCHPASHLSLAATAGVQLHSDRCTHCVSVVKADVFGIGEVSRDQRSSNPHGDGDPDSCVICQVLSAANGVLWRPELIALGHLSFDDARMVCPLACELPAFSIPLSRGPPALVG